MSTQYPELGLTNFPNELDSRYIMLDPSIPSDLSAIDAYNARIAAKDMEGALKVLADNPRLSKMLFNADKWNRHEDMLLALERYYMDDVQQYLVEIVVWRGTWQDGVAYSKYNVVSYLNDEGHEAYMAIQAVPAGIVPTDKTYWIPITLRGQQGAPGTGLSWRGQWDVEVEYFENDCVAYDNKMWAAKQPSTGQTPTPGSEYWDCVFEVDMTAEKLLEKIKTVGGSGSGLDADLLDGHDSSYFAPQSDFTNHIQDEYIHFGLARTENTDGTLYRGTTTPTGTEKLNYSGYFEATRVLGSYFSDYAEFFNVSGELKPGTVVEITGSNRYGACRRDKSPLAIGVVSDDYYMCIGRKPGMDNTPIALAGKVHVRVSGTCMPGDMLVSSPGGTARALQDGEFAPPGAILGQALDFKSENDSELVLMLVMRR